MYGYRLDGITTQMPITARDDAEAAAAFSAAVGEELTITAPADGSPPVYQMVRGFAGQPPEGNGAKPDSARVALYRATEKAGPFLLEVMKPGSTDEVLISERRHGRVEEFAKGAIVAMRGDETALTIVRAERLTGQGEERLRLYTAPAPKIDDKSKYVRSSLIVG